MPIWLIIAGRVLPADAPGIDVTEASHWVREGDERWNVGPPLGAASRKPSRLRAKPAATSATFPSQEPRS